LLRYDAFAELPAAPDVRTKIAARAPELLDIDANLYMHCRLMSATFMLAPRPPPGG
jgi:hypothetical protein